MHVTYYLPVYLLLILSYALAQDANCDFYQKLVVGIKYTINSPGYPNSYTPGAQCRWIADSPSTDYNVRVDCSEVNLPLSDMCSMDRLMVSRSGDPQLNGAEYYCGRTTLSSVSTGTRLSMGLASSRSSPGGRFACTIQTLQKVITPPATCDCGYRKQTRIVGGVETQVNEFPMMVGLGDANIFEIKCGGVIISSRYVMSAAHCLNGYTPANLAVIVGEHDVTTGSDTSAAAGYRIQSFIIHPQYSSSNYDYDVALIKVEKDIVFSAAVGPVCLPFKYVNSDFTGQKLTILGWGTQYPGGPKSNVLRKVDVDVISQPSCQAVIPSLTSRQFCTYTPGKDACQDDSGGPVMFQDSYTGRLFSMGIVSFGQFCATKGQPGVNTKVAALLNWIKANTPDANYCIK